MLTETNKSLYRCQADLQLPLASLLLPAYTSMCILYMCVYVCAVCNVYRIKVHCFRSVKRKLHRK